MSYKRDDGTEVEVEHLVEERGYPGNSWDDPGQPTVITITEAFDADGNEVELTEAERQRIEEEIAVVEDEDPGSLEDDYL